MTKEINLNELPLEVLEAALKTIHDEKGRVEKLGEAFVEATYICLLCGAEEKREFTAKEVLRINSLGDVRHVQLVDDEDKPIYNSVYRYTTHRTSCYRCLPRLCRLPKSDLARIAIKLARSTMFAARRAGRASLDATEEVIKE